MYSIKSYFDVFVLLEHIDFIVEIMKIIVHITTYNLEPSYEASKSICVANRASAPFKLLFLTSNFISFFHSSNYYVVQ